MLFRRLFLTLKQRKINNDSKSIAIRVVLQPQDKTFKDEDIEKIKKDCTVILVSHSSKVLSFCDNTFEIKK